MIEPRHDQGSPPRAYGTRRCTCGAVLAADNPGLSCASCTRSNRDRMERPPVLPPEFFDTPQFRAAFASRQMGRVFRVYRTDPRHWPVYGRDGIGQEVLAAWLGLNQSQVSRMETGRVVPQHLDVLAHYARTLHLPEQFLWFDLPNSSRLSAVSGQQDEDVADVLGRIQKLHAGTVRPEVISQLQDSIRHTVAQYETLEHSHLVRSLLKQYALVNSTLEECNHPAQRQQLCEVAGVMSGVLGYVAVGRGNFPLARAYCLEAFELGECAQKSNMQAWARGIHSFCEYYAGRFGEAVSLAKDGLKYAQSGPQSIRLTINGLARALGKLGDTEGVHRAVDDAYELMSRNDVPNGVPSSISLAVTAPLKPPATRLPRTCRWGRRRRHSIMSISRYPTSASLTPRGAGRL